MQKLPPILQPGTGGGAAAGASSHGSDSREELRAFLQRRVARFGLVLALMFGLFFVWRLIVFLVGDDSRRAGHRGRHSGQRLFHPPART